MQCTNALNTVTVKLPMCAYVIKGIHTFLKSHSFLSSFFINLSHRYNGTFCSELLCDPVCRNGGSCVNGECKYVFFYSLSPSFYNIRKM